MPSSSRSPKTTEYDPVSVTTISGGAPSRPKMTSIMCRESRTVPDTIFAPRPMPRSFMAFSQVMPRFDPKYLRFGRANAAGTGTTNRIPSTATRPPPHAWASGSPACRATSGAFAAARVSGRT